MSLLPASVRPASPGRRRCGRPPARAGGARPRARLVRAGRPLELPLDAAVLYVYPATGTPGRPTPDGWDAIPGARGCTPQSCAFRDHAGELAELGARVAGLSAQPLPSSRSSSPVASTCRFPWSRTRDSTAGRLGLAHVRVRRATLYKRITLVLEAGRVSEGVLSRVPAGPECGRCRRLAASAERAVTRAKPPLVVAALVATLAAGVIAGAERARRCEVRARSTGRRRSIRPRLLRACAGDAGRRRTDVPLPFGRVLSLEGLHEREHRDVHGQRRPAGSLPPSRRPEPRRHDAHRLRQLAAPRHTRRDQRCATDAEGEGHERLVLRPNALRETCKRLVQLRVR